MRYLLKDANMDPNQTTYVQLGAQGDLFASARFDDELINIDGSKASSDDTNWCPDDEACIEIPLTSDSHIVYLEFKVIGGEPVVCNGRCSEQMHDVAHCRVGKRHSTPSRHVEHH